MCFGVGICNAQTQNRELKQFLQQLFAEPRIKPDQTTRFTVAQARLVQNAKPNLVIYVFGQTWCGSGGCTMLVLEPRGGSYKVIGRTTIVQLPIRILHSATNGHRDLGVWVQGGGIKPGYEAMIQFQGNAYSNNPSVPPARKLKSNSEGEILVRRGTRGQPLYDTVSSDL